MGIFSAIMNKLRQHGSQRSDTQQTTGSVQQAQPAAQQSQSDQQQAQPFGQAGQQGASQASMQNVDIDAVLSQLAGQKGGGGGNYRQSIVDLLKLLDLDSSMNARKELAEELNVHVGAHGSAEQNRALHKAVMRKIEDNGGKVPESMKH